MVLALYLGFANISLPHDKWIHFGMFFIMSFLFYWILDSKYTWLARNSTFLICTVVGGIGSEYAQHYISPFRTFDYNDIIFNVCGSLTAIVVSDVYRLFYTGAPAAVDGEEGGPGGVNLGDIC